MTADSKNSTAPVPAAGTDAGNSMWGGRYTTGPAEIMEKINASIDFDKRMYAQDIEGSKAHCRMLVATGVITTEDGGKILAGLDQILAEIEAGQFTFKRSLEDIHMNVEARLTEIIGAPAGRLHTARSRNDQVALDVRLWVRDAADRADCATGRSAGRIGRPRRGICRCGDAGLHPSADRAAGDLRPSPDGLCRDGRARPRPFPGRAPADERIAAGRRRAGGHLLSDRPRHDGEGSGLRPADGEFAGCRGGSRFRARVPGRRLDPGDAPVAPGRGDRDLVQRAVPLRAAERRVFHRLLDHAAKAQSRRGGTGARQGRPGESAR